MRANRSTRTRTVENTIPRDRILRHDRSHPETGLVTSERVARLCGEHLEHAYEALRLTTHGIACVSCCYHQDLPNTIICSTSSNCIALYDAARILCISQQAKGPRRCSSAFNPSLSHVAVYGDPMAPAIELQLCTSGKFAFLEGHTAEVRCCCVSVDGSLVISGGRDGQAFLWNVTQPGGLTADPYISRFSLPGHAEGSQVKACCVSADGRWAATGGTDGNVLLWDLAGLQPTSTIAPAASGQRGNSSSLNGSQPAAAGVASSSQVPAAVGAVQLAALLELPKGEQVSCLDLSINGSWLVVGTRSGKVHVRSPEAQQLQQLPARHQEGSKVRCCTVSPDASKLISSADDARLVLWDLKSSTSIVSVHEHFKPIRGCCWSPDGKHIVTVGMDCLLCVLDVVLLNNNTRLRIAMRLDTAPAARSSLSSQPSPECNLTADWQDAAAAAQAVGVSCSPSESAVPSHPLLKRTGVAERGTKLLACVPVNQLELHSSSSMAPAVEEATSDAVLCADQSGQVSVLLPGHVGATDTGISVGSGFSYCCFDGSVLAAARRDGALTVLSCSSAAGPAAVTASAGGLDDYDVAGVAHWDPPVAVSAKMDMLVSGISVNRQLGRVALVGTERKQHMTGVMWLWEYDPSVRPSALSGADDELRGVSTLDPMTRLASMRSGMLSSGESRIPSIGSPRGVSDCADSDGKHSSTEQARGKLHKGVEGGVLQHGSDSHSGVTPAAAAIGPNGWLWHCGNPFKLLTIPDTALACCAWAGGEHARLAVGSAAGWLAVVNLEGEELQQQSMTRYQIHCSEVTAVGFAADGATVVSGSLDGRVVIWSHVTGFKLAGLTLHSAAIRTLAFNPDTTLLAIGDAAGIVSSWDIVQGCLVSAAQAHDGPVSSVSWMLTGAATGFLHSSWGRSATSSSVISCGYDGAVAELQPDHSIPMLYSAAFRGLYYSCKKNNKVHKLEAALLWHLQQGVLQDPSVLQLLVTLAATDGNVAVLSLLLPLFEKMGWLLHFGPAWASPSGALPKTDSDKSLLSRKSYFQSHQQQQRQQQNTDASFGGEYVIHPHDRQADLSVIGALPGSRRGTKESAQKPGHARSHTLGDNPLGVDGAVRNTRWSSSVADIRTLLAFNIPQLQPKGHAQHSSSGAAGAAGRGPAAGTRGTTPGDNVALHVSAAGLGLNDSEGSGSPANSNSSAANSPALTPSNLTPTRLLSPVTSRNARQPAALPPGLDTLHEESHSPLAGEQHPSTEQSSLAGAAGAAAPPAGGDVGGSGGGGSPPGSPRVGLVLRPDEDAGSGSVSNASTPRCLMRSLTPPACSPLQVQGSVGASGYVHGSTNSPRLAGQPRHSSSPFSQPQHSPDGHDSSGSAQQQQQQHHQSSMGRKLMSFLSARRRATEGSRGEAGSPDDSDASLPLSVNVRQRSLSEGASLAQRISTYRAGGLALHTLAGTRYQHDEGVGSGSAAAFDGAATAAVASAAGRGGEDTAWGIGSRATGGTCAEHAGTLSAQSSRKQRSTKDFLLMLPFGSSKRSMMSRGSMEVVASDRAHELTTRQSGFSASSLRADGFVGSAKRRFMSSWTSWRGHGSKSGQHVQPQQSLQQPQKSLQPPGSRAHKSRGRRDDLLQTAMASQQAQCVRMIVDALLEGRFSKASVVAHMYEALQALIHDPQHKRACRRLLKHLPMIELGEVEVDSLLTHNAKILYKCSAPVVPTFTRHMQKGNPGTLWASATSGQQPLLDALDVLIKRASWRDSIVALIMWPVTAMCRYLGTVWLWLWTTQGLGARHRVQVSARSQLVPVARAAEIRSGSRGNLLRQLLSANVDADLYGKELVRAVINVKWESFARAFLLMQGVQFVAFIVFFLAYLSVAVYGNDPNWTTSEMLAQPQGRAAVGLECILMIMMFGQAADEGKQIVTYGRDYFNSPWNYMDLASCCIIAILFLLHISRLNHQLFVILVALEVLLLCLRSLYFCMAIDQVGALLRMVLIVIRDMRYFFMLLIFLLISFGLTFSVLMSPASTARLNIISLVGSSTTDASAADVQVFGSLEDSMTQLFTMLFGDVQFTTLKTIMSVNTVASRLAVILACVYAVLTLIVLVNLLIAIVDETYGTVKESEADQMLRNKALIIDEIESTLTDAVINDLNSRVLLPYVHILIPQAARMEQHTRRRDLHAKFRKLKQFMKERLPSDPGLAAFRSGVPRTSDTHSAGGAGAVMQQHALTVGLWSGTGQQHPAAVSAAVTVAPAAAAAGAAGLSAPRSSGSGQPVAFGGSAGAPPSPTAHGVVDEGTAAAAATARIQQDIVQLSPSVSSINHQLEVVADSSAAAVAELAAKVEGLQGDIGQIKELLLALLAKQQ